MQSPVDEDAVIEEHGVCICIGCVGFYRRCRDRDGELVLVCSSCSVAFELDED
jgi:hypothetical protein